MKRFLLLPLMACLSVVGMSGQEKVEKILFPEDSLSLLVDSIKADSIGNPVHLNDSLLLSADSMNVDRVEGTVSLEDSLRTMPDSIKADSVEKAAFPEKPILPKQILCTTMILHFCALSV